MCLFWEFPEQCIQSLYTNIGLQANTTLIFVCDCAYEEQKYGKMCPTHLQETRIYQLKCILKLDLFENERI